MMKHALATAASMIAALWAAQSFAFGDADVGKPAPPFSIADAEGKTVKLSDFRGKPVVLEWTNNGCPFVHHMYESGVMQSLQRRASAEGVVWLSVISSAPGKQGYLTAPEVKRWEVDTGAAPADVLLDPRGTLGRTYGAKATPTMFVIDRSGTVIYMGAIDDHPSASADDARRAKNYVALALQDLKTGHPVADPVTLAYGCSVKY
jgi:hypothetical protein